jgi:uncharacterized protein (TIGR03382 family)
MKSVSAAALAALLVPAVAHAERPFTGYVAADPELIDVVSPTALSSRTIFLDGCFGAGCTVQFGREDARTNRSSIAEGTLTEFKYGTVTWDAVVECVKKNYEPFDVEITDVDPGSAPHWKAMVAGYPEEIGMEGAGGVSPWGPCGVINNAITFSFANIYAGNVDEICWVVSQETAHAFGLEHEFLCEDPLTYREDCKPRKYFHNVDAPCGEWNPRACECGGSEQNSFQMLTDLFGPGTVEQPVVAITAPRDGQSVEAGYAIRATVEDGVPLTSLKAFVNGRLVGEVNQEPWVFNAPATLSDGRHKVELRATNAYGATSIAEVQAAQGEPCEAADDCADTEACVDGRCVVGPGQPGGLGEICTGNGDCSSGMCGSADDGQYCAETCELGGGGCPSGFGCIDTPIGGVCWKGADDGGGCSTGGGAAGPIALAFAALALAVRRRRR